MEHGIWIRPQYGLLHIDLLKKFGLWIQQRYDIDPAGAILQFFSIKGGGGEIILES